MRKTCVLRRLPSGPTTGRLCQSRLGPHHRVRTRAGGKEARGRLQAMDETTDAVVAARENVFGREILGKRRWALRPRSHLAWITSRQGSHSLLLRELW